MSIVRRIEVVGILVLVVAGLAMAGVGSALGMAGVQPPREVSAVLSAGGDVLGWLRLAVVVLLGYGVVRARENA
jgi:hypothetical protein